MKEPEEQIDGQMSLEGLMVKIKLVIEIPEETYRSIQDNDYCGISNGDMYEAIKNGMPLKECDQWKQLKEIISEIRDNNEFEKDDVTTLCRFLLNYMGVLESEDKGW